MPGTFIKVELPMMPKIRMIRTPGTFGNMSDAIDRTIWILGVPGLTAVRFYVAHDDLLVLLEFGKNLI